MNHYRLNKLFSAFQAVIPSRSFISTLSLSAALTLQLGLITPTFAVDATTTTATDPTTTTTDPTTVVDEQALLKSAQSLFSMSMQNDANGLEITITGLAPTQIDKIFFDGADVSELVNNLITQGIATATETENSYTLNVALSSQIEGEHTLAISTAEGAYLSKKVTLEKYDANKIDQLREMAGTAYIKKYKARSSELLTKTFTIVYYHTRNPSQLYKVQVTPTNNGGYDTSCLKSTNSELCKGADRAFCTYSDKTGVYTSTTINLKSYWYYLQAASCSVMNQR